MAQTLKTEVEERIRDSALEEFSARGYTAATVGDIARRAGISTGNVYRYFGSKELLLEAVLPPTLVRRFLQLMHGRVDALKGVADYRRLPQSAGFHEAARRMLDFAVEHRREVLILLARAEGTPHERVAERLVRWLVQSAILHFRDRGLEGPDGVESILELIYRNYVAALAQILAEHREPRAIRRLVEGYARYHLAGMNAPFEG